jgi:peptide/nickel transport system ATP-binding protein
MPSILAQWSAGDSVSRCSPRANREAAVGDRRGETVLCIDALRTWLDTGHDVVRAIDGLSLDVGRGECVALLGESGCGKSMTALSVLRLLPDAGQVVSGRVCLDGQDLLALPEAEMRRIRGRRIAMIFQEPMLSLDPVMTVGDQIVEAIRQHTAADRQAAGLRAIELLGTVGIPDPQRRVSEFPFQLSGGMKQRVMIAMALACDPDVLIADEPTTALDVTIQAQILDVLRTLQRDRGMALLLITHDLGVVAEMAQRVAVMYAGELVELSARDRFFQSPCHPYARKLFDSVPRRARRNLPLAVIRGAVPPLSAVFQGCRFADRCDVAWERCRTEVPLWRDTPGGQSARCHLLDPAEGGHGDGGKAVAAEAVPPPDLALVASDVGAPAPVLAVRDLRVHFPVRSGLLRRVSAHVRAVDGVSLTIRKGRTLALVGESGCGKTTVGKGILQLVPVTGGSVVFDGVDLATLGGAALRERRRDIQVVFQDPYASLDPRMRVMDTIAEGMESLGIGEGGEERQRRVDALLAEVGLSPAMKTRYPHEFSGGQRQRIAIARALAVEPKLIICDEPTSALDVSVQAQILNLLGALQRRHGLSYLFITHNIGVVEFLAHDVAVMYLGRIVEQGATVDVLDSPRHPYTQALLSAVPSMDPERRSERVRVTGEMPSPVKPPSGCHFHPRCPHASATCRVRYPEATASTEGSAGAGAARFVHCHLYGAAPGADR